MRFSAIAITFFASVIAIGMSSCTQEYRCQCTIKYSGMAGLPDSSMNEYTIKDTKKKAQSLCKENSVTMDKNGVTTTETCQLF
ncbi:hypothetical protein [Rurimicrobium arvi]|uniref:Uncharacterized protein n=1 Tax=Rurimicrobium arvi TaxID=2049916 RepID=A0ABP8MDP2_9BACT